jgi:peptide/nickel transport system substrate-binding protein
VVAIDKSEGGARFNYIIGSVSKTNIQFLEEKMKKRIILYVISILIVGSMLLSACGTPAASTPGKFLTVNYEQVSTWVRNFNPFSSSALGSTATAIYEPMMIYNKSTGELVPWLATSYAWSADNLTLTFTIRKNVKWSDGQPFTAKDVVYTYDLLKNNEALTGTATSVLGEYIDSYSAPDDNTMEFKFKSVYTPALYDIANQIIVPEHIWKDISDPLTWTNDNPVATGPFTQVTKFESQIYVLEKNTHYWQEGKPAFQGIRYPAYADNDAANLALVNGDLDWTGNFVPDIQTTYVDKNPENNHYYFVGGDGISLMINSTLKTFDDPNIRKAISMGIDRSMIVKTAMFDYIPVADATGLGDTYKVWKDQAAIDAGTWMTYDAAKANEVLDAAGFTRGADGTRVDKDGNPMKYDLIVPSGWTDWISACQIISQNMTDLGISINLTTPEETAWTDSVTKGEFEWALGWGSGGPTPYNFYRGQMSKLTAQPIGESASENWTRFVSPEADVLLDQFAKTSDVTEQKSIMADIEKLFVDLAPVLPLFPGPDWYEYSTARFTGWPSQDNNYAPGVPYGYSPYNATLIVLTTITPK